jgi:hypothetical protein
LKIKNGENIFMIEKDKTAIQKKNAFQNLQPSTIIQKDLLENKNEKSFNKWLLNSKNESKKIRIKDGKEHS